MKSGNGSRYRGISLWRHVASAGVFLLLISAPFMTNADEKVLPPSFDGVWVQGNCQSPSRVRILNAFAVTDFLEIGGRQHVQIMLIDELNAVKSQSVTAGFISPGTGERVKLDLAIDDGRIDGLWIRCPSVPPTLRWGFGEGIAVLEAMGKIRRGCSGAHRGQQCLMSIWDYVDVSGDSKVSKAEATRGLRGMVFFVSYAMQQQGLVPTDELVPPMAVGALIAQWLASSIVQGADYDGDGLLSMNELFQDRGDLTEIVTAMEKLGPEGVVTGVDQSRSALQQVLQPLLQVSGRLMQLFLR